MKEAFELKYRKVLEILPDVAECANRDLVLVGGTALALFHLNHRVSVDLDFIPVKGNDEELKERLKGCLTKKGYTTQRAAHINQFVIQFENTGIKIEIFSPNTQIRRIEEHVYGNRLILVASVEDIMHLKQESYLDRRAARDLFDIVFILKDQGGDFSQISELIGKVGQPDDIQGIEAMVLKKEDYEFFRKVIKDASETSSKL
jgi:predicted nucleotidyltransferase component of viral defense system